LSGEEEQSKASIRSFDFMVEKSNDLVDEFEEGGEPCFPVNLLTGRQ